MSRPAITPSDAGAPPAGVAIGPTVADCVERFTAPAQHPVNVANRERSMQAANLATVIANDVVRDVIARNAACFRAAGHQWFDTNCATFNDVDEEGLCLRRVERAIRYIELRDPDAFPFRFIRHPEQPHLVRFEDKP